MARNKRSSGNNNTTANRNEGRATSRSRSPRAYDGGEREYRRRDDDRRGAGGGAVSQATPMNVWQGGREGGGGEGGGGRTRASRREQFQLPERLNIPPPTTAPRGSGHDNYTPHGANYNREGHYGSFNHNNYNNNRGMANLPPRPPPSTAMPVHGYAARPPTHTRFFHDDRHQQAPQKGGWKPQNLQRPGGGWRQMEEFERNEQPHPDYVKRGAYNPPSAPQGRAQHISQRGHAQPEERKHNFGFTIQRQYGGAPDGKHNPQPTTQHQYGGAAYDRTAQPTIAPVATAAYLEQSLQPSQKLSTPKELLVILDLNGTLLFRKKGRNATGSSAPTLRPGLSGFLNYVTGNFKVMIWTSARPDNAKRMVDAAFTKKQKQKLVAVWARDTLGLTSSQYNAKVQVYKTLERIWNGRFAIKGKAAFDQTNTVLFDDSTEKAVGHPYNLVCVPEFDGNQSQITGDMVLQQCIEYLEKLKWQSDVSAYIRAHPFESVTKSKGTPKGAGPRQTAKELSVDEDDVAEHKEDGEEEDEDGYPEDKEEGEEEEEDDYAEDKEESEDQEEGGVKLRGWRR